MKFITNEPALLINKTLIITDLHIGIEYEFYKSGMNIPSQLGKMIERINDLLETIDTEKLIILGDIKHKVPGTSFQELREIPEFLTQISNKIKVEIIPGNHDSGLHKIIPDVKMHKSSGIKLKNFYIIHGHAWPSPEFLKCEYIIMGHVHPRFEFRDKLGYRWLESIWLKSELKKECIRKKYKINVEDIPKLVIMPAFNTFAGGLPVNRNLSYLYGAGNNRFISPITRCINTKSMESYLLDGTSLGNLNIKSLVE